MTYSQITPVAVEMSANDLASNPNGTLTDMIDWCEDNIGTRSIMHDNDPDYELSATFPWSVRRAISLSDMKESIRFSFPSKEFAVEFKLRWL